MTETTQPQANAEAQPANEPAQTRTKTFIVDGQTIEVDAEKYDREYQKDLAGDRKLKEASELRKQLETFLENSRAKPAELLSQLGVNPQEFAKQLLLAEIEKEEHAANPDRAEIAALKKEVQAIREAEGKKQKESDEARAQAEENDLVAKIDNGISQTLEDIGVPMGSAPAELIADIAEQMLAEYKSSKKNLDPKEALSRAKTSFQRRLNAVAKGAPKAILELLSPEHLDVIAEAYISKRKPKETPSLKSSTPATHEGKEEAVNKQLYDFFKRKS